MAELAVAVAGAALGSVALPAGITIGSAVFSGASIGWAIGSMAGAMLFGEKMPDSVGPRIGDGKITASTYGVPIPKAWGKVSLSGNIIDASPVREIAHTRDVGGKDFGGGQSATTFTYEADLAVAICDHEIDAIIQIYANEQLIYDATPGATVVQPDWLSWTLYNGTETQLADPTLEAVHGAGNVPPYRGVAYVVFRSFQFGSSSLAVNFRFVVARSATPSITETEVDLPGAARNGIVAYSPRADLVIVPLTYGSGAAAGADAAIICALDPYSRTLVWQTTLANSDIYWRHRSIVSCVRPEYVGLPEAADTAIAMTSARTTPDGVTVRFFDAITGASISNFDVHASSTSTAIAFWQTESLSGIQVWNTSIGTVGLSRITFTGLTYIVEDLAAPSGYAWQSPGNTCDPSSNGAGAICVPAETDPAGNPAVVILTATGDIYSASLAVDMPTNSDAVIGLTWDASAAVWWALTNTTGLTPPRVRLHSITVGGTVTTYDMQTLYSQAAPVDPFGDRPRLWLDAVDRVLWWRSSTSALYAWAPAGGVAPTVYTGGTTNAGVLYHRGTRTVWGGNASDPNGSLWGVHTAGIVGASASLQTIVESLCDGTEIQTEDRTAAALSAVTVQGFSISRDMARRDALQALRAVYLFDFVPRNAVLTAILRGSASAGSLTVDDLGAHVAGTTPPDAPIGIRVRAEADLPRQLDMTYISAEQNYEPVTISARRLASQGGTVQRIEIPVVLTETEAAEAVDVMLHLQHIGAEQYDGTAMPSTADTCQPGAVVTAAVDGVSYTWRLESASVVDAGIVELRGQRDDTALYASYAVGGALRSRNRTVDAAGAMLLWPLDLPLLRASDDDAGIYLAAGSYTPGWPGGQVYHSIDNATFAPLISMDTHAAVGVCLSSVADWPERTFDTDTVISVRPINSSFANATSWDAAVTDGNLAAWGQSGRWEIVAFANASEQADGTFNISNLARGLRDSQDAMAGHVAGDLFVVLDAAALGRVTWSSDQYQVSRWLKGVTIGKIVDEAVAQSVTPQGGALRPFAPCSLHASRNASGVWSLSWMRQDRSLTRPFWQAPQSEAAESYRVHVYNSLGVRLNTYTATTSSYSYTVEQQTTDYGAETEKVHFSVTQFSATVGEGHDSGIVTVGNDYKLTDVSGSASAYLSSGDHLSFTKDKAFDASTTSYWNANCTFSGCASPAPWIGAQWATAQSIRRITIIQHTFVGSNEGMASQIAVEYSDDGSAWTELERIDLAQTDGVRESFDLSLTSAHTYWRIRATAFTVSGLYRWAVNDIEFMAPIV